jgi:hypothetical protein
VEVPDDATINFPGLSSMSRSIAMLAHVCVHVRMWWRCLVRSVCPCACACAHCHPAGARRRGPFPADAQCQHDRASLRSIEVCIRLPWGHCRGFDFTTVHQGHGPSMVRYAFPGSGMAPAAAGRRDS